jgi:PiT family inorganic phosphate transporter
MELFGETLSIGSAAFLLFALGLALSFEFVNGFHDTANAVATVIYTHSLKPMVAVVWSGCWNLIGVLTSSGAVAFSVLALLPVELVLNVGSVAGFAMVFSLLVSAIIWNLGTWYLGLPASSSHALIGSIMGVGLANSWFSPGQVFGEGVNWAKATDVFESLLISPVVGFTASALLLLFMKALVRKPELYQAPAKDQPPPAWIRGLLILTCTGVSFGHGSNDGQKGMGLIMLILIGILPTTYALDSTTNQAAIQELTAASRTVSYQMDRRAHGAAMPGPEAATEELSSYLKTTGGLTDRTFAGIAAKCRGISELLNGKTRLTDLSPKERRLFRSDLYLTSESLGKLAEQHQLPDPAEQKAASMLKRQIDRVTKFIPVWVKVAVALALGLGTMIGWKRIVVTVGEKIGKTHLTYGQGATAELVAMATILAADRYGLPVSTTHVLSSGVAGTMVANHSGVQLETLRNLLLAWVLTLPVTVLLGAGIFAFALNVLIRFGVN